jgi:hypothetical protein
VPTVFLQNAKGLNAYAQTQLTRVGQAEGLL